MPAVMPLAVATVVARAAAVTRVVAARVQVAMPLAPDMAVVTKESTAGGSDKSIPKDFHRRGRRERGGKPMSVLFISIFPLRTSASSAVNRFFSFLLTHSAFSTAWSSG